MPDSTSWKVAWKKNATAWGTGTPATVGANDGFYLSAEGMSEGVFEPIKDEVIGKALAGQPLQGNLKADGSFSEIVRYEGFERRLAQFMCDNYSASQITTTGVYQHPMLFKSDTTGKHGVLVIDKGLGTDKTWEYAHTKLNSLELTHDNGRLIANWGAIASKLNRSAAATNKSTAMGTVTVPSPESMAIFNQLTVLYQEVTGTDTNLSAPTDELLVSSATLSINRNLSGDYVCGTNAGGVDEPALNGFPEATLKLTFPNYTVALDTLISAAQVRQTGSIPKRFKFQLNWKGGAASATPTVEYWLMNWYLGSVTIASAPANAGSAGAKVPIEMTFVVTTPQSTPVGTDWTWCTSSTSGVKVLLQNKQTTSGY